MPWQLAQIYKYPSKYRDGLIGLKLLTLRKAAFVCIEYVHLKR